MAKQTTLSRRFQAIRNEFLVNGVDMFKQYDFEYTTIDTSILPPLSSSDVDSDEDLCKPKFMQTEEQKKRRTESLKKRELLRAIRRLRLVRVETPREITLPSGRIRKVRKESIRRTHRQMKDPFKHRPSDIILDIMRHTRYDNFDELMDLSPTAEDLYVNNADACMIGIEAEQYSQTKWLFGNSRHRTLEQKQAFKDWTSTYYITDTPLDVVIQDFDKIDDGSFRGPRLLERLQYVQDVVDDWIQNLEKTTGIEVTRRAALCMQALTMDNSEVVELDNFLGGGKTKGVHLSEFPTEKRISLFKSQPITTQAEIRKIFEELIRCTASASARGMSRWVRHYYKQRPTNHAGALKTMNAWLTRLAVGLITQIILVYPGLDVMTFAHLCWHSTELPTFTKVLELESDVDGHGTQRVKAGMEFAEGIGIDIGEELPRSIIESTLKELQREKDERKEAKRSEASLDAETNKVPHEPGVYRVVHKPWTLV